MAGSPQDPNMVLGSIYARICNGDPNLNAMERNYLLEMGNYIARLLEGGSIYPNQIQMITTFILICNVVYNNISNAEPVVPDEVYDRIVVMCHKLGISIPVGAPPVSFNTKDSIGARDRGEDDVDENGKKIIVSRVPDLDKRMFYSSMTSNITLPIPEDYTYSLDTTKVKKKMRAVAHNYDMCGTLEKCKYVLNADAARAGKLNDPGTMIFERDFICKHIQAGIVNPDHIEVMVSLKMDGISVENTIKGNEVVFSCTRGDTSNNEAADLTPIFGGTTFPRGKYLSKGNNPIGVKFEYIITWSNLKRVSELFGKTYVNPRNAVIGLTSGLDARKYRDFLTPVPLETSLYEVDREDEVLFMNSHFTKGVDFRYAIIKGNYAEVMYMIRKYLEEADSLREFMDFAYDGIVVEYLDPNIRHMLGKRDAIPLYSIAIKFDPLKKYSTFTHYTYTVGQDGVITPMAHFLPVYFYGNKQTHATAHSYERFKKLGLHVGDKVLLSYNNEVMTYITRAPQDMQDPNNHNPLIEFPTHCPSCGQPLYISESEASVFCSNLWCPERALARLSNMLKKVGLKGFSDRTIANLGVLHISELYNYDHDKMDSIIGPTNGANFRAELERIKNAGLPDYRLIGSIGFSNIAEKTWKTILEQFPIERVMTEPNESFKYLEGINGIGPTTVETILQERPFFIEELKFIFSNFKYTKSKDYNGRSITQVVFTGFRDKKLSELFNATGLYDADQNNTLTKKTGILVVPSTGYTEGSKIKKAFTMLGDRYSKSFNLPPTSINWTNLHMLRGVAGMIPQIITRDEAYAMLSNGKK